jgi:hypothetical protein
MKIVARCKGMRATHANAITRDKGSKAQRHKGSTDECNNKCKNSNKVQGVKKLYNNGKEKALTKLKKKTQTKTSFNSQNSRLNEENIQEEQEGEKRPFCKKYYGLQEVAVGMRCLQPNPKSTLDAPRDPDPGKGSDLTQFSIFFSKLVFTIQLSHK